MSYGDDYGVWSDTDSPQLAKKKTYKKQQQRKPRKPVYVPNEDGTPPSAETLEKLRKRGLNYCYWMLGSSDKTEKYLRDKMVKKGYPETVIDDVMDSLKEDHYVDDESFAKRFAADRLEFGNKGSRAIKFDLMRKGVAPETIAEVLEEIDDPDMEEEKARAFIAPKVARTRDVDKQKRITRLASSLARRGYDPSMSFRIVKEAVELDIEENPPTLDEE